MSRIGKKPVELPTGTTVSLKGQTVEVKGPKGVRTFTLNDEILCSVEGNVVTVKPRDDSKKARSLWGMSRTMIRNLGIGVTDGFKKELEINGVGYRAAIDGKNVKLALGFSHDVIYPIPEGIQITCPKPTAIVVEGIDQQRVGQVAAELRGFRGPEPYKGKGVKYVGEFIFRKEGKKK